MPSDYIKLLEQRVKEARPDLDTRDFTALHDLLIKPHALLLEPLQADIDALKAAQSLASSNISDEEIDNLVANIFLSRRDGVTATGLARVYVTTPATLVFDQDSVFVASNGSTYVPIQQISFPEALVRLNVDGSMYYVDVPVMAEDSGEKARIKAHTLSTMQGSSINFVKVDNPYPFSGGVDRETNAELTARAADAITVRDLVSGRGILTRLMQVFSFIERTFIAGHLDPEQQRDLVNGIHVGGKGDVRIKPASLLADQVKITVPNVDGSFVLSSGSGAPGDSQRPVVFVDSVRLLGPGPTYVPIGTPRTREETTLVDIKAIVGQGEFRQAKAAINTTLNQILVVAVEVASPTQQFISITRLDIQGNTQTPFTRITEPLEKAASPHVVINPSNNRAYVFWDEDGTLKYQVLDTAGIGFGIVKPSSDLVAGTDELLGRMDSAFSSDNHLHLTFTLRSIEIDGTPLDSVWYARLDPDGEIPELNAPKQVVFDLSGNNGDSSIVVHGAGTSLVVTIAFASKRDTFSNLYALQLDDAGAALTLSTQLTSGYEWNDQPRIRKGVGDNIHLTFRRNFRGISYIQFKKTGLVISVARKDTLVRTLDIDEVQMVVNPYGYPYVYWSEFSGDFDDIFSAKIDTKGNRIGPMHDLSVTPYFSSYPTLLSDASGALHLIWVDGIRGYDKPFYLKRLPQEWRLIVKDPRFRYSTKEELSVAVELPAANGVAADIRWADLLPQVQDFVESEEERTIVADLLVRNQIPATCTCSVVFGPQGGALTESAAKGVIEGYINNLEEESLKVSAIINALHAAGATSVSPFSVTVKTDRDDGTILIQESDDVLQLPRGTFLTAVGVTATYRSTANSR